MMFINRVNPQEDARAIHDRMRRVEDQVLSLKRSGYTKNATSVTTNVVGGTGINAAQLLNLLSKLLVFSEDISGAGTSHVLAYRAMHAPDGTPLVMLVLNGQVMRWGASGANGWTISGYQTITTIHTLSANDKLIAYYVRAFL